MLVPSILMKAGFFLFVIIPIIAERVLSGLTIRTGLKTMMILLILFRPMRAATWFKFGLIFANSFCVHVSQLDRGGVMGGFKVR